MLTWIHRTLNKQILIHMMDSLIFKRSFWTKVQPRNVLKISSQCFFWITARRCIHFIHGQSHRLPARHSIPCRHRLSRVSKNSEQKEPNTENIEFCSFILFLGFETKHRPETKINNVDALSSYTLMHITYDELTLKIMKAQENGTRIHLFPASKQQRRKQQ